MPLETEQTNLSELEYLKKELLSLIEECKKLKNTISRLQNIFILDIPLEKKPSVLHGHKKDVFKITWRGGKNVR